MTRGQLGNIGLHTGACSNVVLLTYGTYYVLNYDYVVDNKTSRIESNNTGTFYNYVACGAGEDICDPALTNKQND